MTASDDARQAMAGAEAAGWHPKDWVDAAMPDGRTIGQWLDALADQDRRRMQDALARAQRTAITTGEAAR